MNLMNLCRLCRHVLHSSPIAAIPAILCCTIILKLYHAITIVDCAMRRRTALLLRRSEAFAHVCKFASPRRFCWGGGKRGLAGIKADPAKGLPGCDPLSYLDLIILKF